MNKRVLLVDNDTDFLDSAARMLMDAGYRVFKASTVEDAEQVLMSAWIHIVVIDLRMKDDRDEKDISGLLFAKKRIYQSIPKIILTRFPTVETVKEALSSTLEAVPPVVDFIGKQDNPDAVIKALEHAYQQHVRINWDLEIDLDEAISLAFLTTLLEAAGNSAWLADRTIELEDLFRRLFYDYAQINLRRIFWHHNGKIAIEVFAYSSDRETQFIVSCGSASQIKVEIERFHQGDPKTSQGTHLAIGLNAETLHFGAIAWEVTGLKIDESETFSQFLNRGAEKPLRNAIEYLFRITLAPWYSSSNQMEDSMGGCVEISRKATGITINENAHTELRQNIDALCDVSRVRGLAQIESRPNELVFSFPLTKPLVLPNPVSYLLEEGKLPDYAIRRFLGPAEIDPDAVLVDLEGHAVLTDFATLGTPAIYQSFASLESAIRFRLLGERNLLSLYDFEQQLIKGDSLTSSKVVRTDVEPSCRPPLAAIKAIRDLAAKFGGDDLQSYFTVLLFLVMKDLMSYDWKRKQPIREIKPMVHRLMLGAMLCKKFSEISRRDAGPSPAKGLPRFHVDEANRNARLGDKEISLTPTEFDLILYLFQHAGQLCPRSNIVRDVFGYAQADKAAQVSLVNTNINRLREKIEPDASRPVYILTVRGQGYKLNQAPI